MKDGGAPRWAGFLRRPTFRMAMLFSVVFAMSTLLLFAFVFWQTEIIETSRVDAMLAADARSLARQSPDALREALETRVMPDLRPMSYAALFAARHDRIVGNFVEFPQDLPLDGASHRILARGRAAGEANAIRAAGLTLPDGSILVIGRPIDSIENLQQVVFRVLELGLVPAILLSLVAGAAISHRTHRQLQAVHGTAERILRGNLRERLPVRGGDDDFDRLAASVNRMLDEIARLMDDMKSTSDNIAHDLRTPLTRVRTRLERARDTAKTHEDLQKMVDQSIIGLDQALKLITALLRIGEIEGGRRRAAFEPVDLATIATEILDLYEPFAEEKQVAFGLALDRVPAVTGDPDLLCELLANLVDKALKFTPAGGHVTVRLANGADGPVLSVADSGPGIPVDQREAVFQRFYRADVSRSNVGYGLGLSLVAAIATLHGFRLSILDNDPGCVIQLETKVG